MSYHSLEEKVRQWAATQPDVWAVVVVGSRARVAPPPDDWSDLDLIVFATNPAQWAGNGDWLSAFGDVLVPVLECYQNGDCEWLVVFADAQKADFYLTPGQADLDAIWPAATYAPVLRRGARLLYAQPGVRLTLAAAPPAASLPTESEFQTAVYSLLLYALRAARFLRRNDLWRARLLLDETLRTGLLRMMEWHALAQRGPDHDVWYNGRYLTEWADPRLLTALPTLFGGFTTDEAWFNLLSSLSVLYWLAEETAVACQFTFPRPAYDQVSAWIQDLYLTRRRPTPGAAPD